MFIPLLLLKVLLIMMVKVLIIMVSLFNFHYSFLIFSSEKSIFHVNFGTAAGKVTPFLTESIGEKMV